MMTIQQITNKFEEKGFKVTRKWNARGHGSYEFKIEKDNTFAVGTYEWHPEWDGERISWYQKNFIIDLIKEWEQAFMRYFDEAQRRYTKDILNSIYGVNAMTEMLYRRDDLRMKAITNNPTIKDVVFNNPATIVFWSDGTKTVVKCQGDEVYDPEKGLAMAISKKVLGGNYDYYNTFKKYLKKYEKQVCNSSLEVTPSKRMPVDYVSKINVPLCSVSKQPTLEEMVNKLNQLTGKDIEELIQLCAAGYTLQAPAVSTILSTDDIPKPKKEE